MHADQADYVIVGAGSAGCVLANRLSANARHRVLLLEAGPRDRSLWIHLPIGYGKTMFHPVYNWGFYTDPEPGMNGRRIYRPRGRGLGGSSSINGLIYVRGQPEDYDHWAVAEEYRPGAQANTDADLLEFARNYGATIFHPSGTCKMGSDPMAVVDERLRVHGVAGLRVVDCSNMPTLISGTHTLRR